MAMFVGLLPTATVPISLMAFAEVHREHPDTRYVIVGSGPYEAALRAKYPQYRTVAFVAVLVFDVVDVVGWSAAD